MRWDKIIFPKEVGELFALCKISTRPFKNRADLELELDIKAKKLDLVLEILIKSGF